VSPGERTVVLTVNGEPRTVSVSPSTTLLEMVRTRLELTGSKECCSEGECGACTVILDGKPVNSCLVLALEADGSSVTTIEGVGSGGMTGLQQSFLEAGAVQCGFCIPGMVVAATAFLERVPRPTAGEVREGLSGNLCRCGGYARICEAVLQAAGAGGADA
jgi:carbon-monoxide dehydrogenase small subunit